MGGLPSCLYKLQENSTFDSCYFSGGLPQKLDDADKKLESCLEPVYDRIRGSID